MMNWGWKIAIGYSGFVVFILFLVFKTTGVDFELVTADYYSAELAFQDQIDKKENSVEDNRDVKIFIESDGVALQLSDYDSEMDFSGTVSFFRASDSKLDRNFEWSMNSKGMMFLDKSNFERGHYTFKADWKEDGKAFYLEKPVFIP